MVVYFHVKQNHGPLSITPGDRSWDAPFFSNRIFDNQFKLNPLPTTIFKTPISGRFWF